ncbi:hypothetical protein AAVH_41508, partial [Aphelenchoides avenae]
MWRALESFGLFCCLQAVIAHREDATIPLYRAWKSGDRGDHFYTVSFDEWQNAVKNLGYKDQGVSGRIFANASDGTSPLYRLFHSGVVDHFYTTSVSERDAAVYRLGFK